MKVLFTNYHVSVNQTLVKDLSALGHEIWLPDNNTKDWKLSFFAPNDEHIGTPGVKIATVHEFMEAEPMAIIIPCTQLLGDLTRLWEKRGKIDKLIYLTALSTSVNDYPLDGADFVMSHDLYYHRATKAKYKIWYFSRPTLRVEPKTPQQLRSTFDEKKVKLYINNFDQAGFEPEYAAAKDLRIWWEKEFDYRIPFYGYGMPDGWPKPEEVQRHMQESMFTLVFKRRETWGQMVNESMLIGTPCIFLEEFINSTFTEYLITKDTAVLAKTVIDIVDQVKKMSFEEYESLVKTTQYMSDMFCDDEKRRGQLNWLLSKVQESLT